MRRRRSQGALSGILNAGVKFCGFVLLPLVLLFKLSDSASLRRRNARFASEIADAYAALVAKHQGVISAGLVTERGGSFDYVEASLEFADRTLRSVRGRDEFTISCNGSPVFFGQDDASFRSAMFIEEHWNELLDADYNQIQTWLRTDA
jgi:hypothetical protein